MEKFWNSIPNNNSSIFDEAEKGAITILFLDFLVQIAVGNYKRIMHK